MKAATGELNMTVVTIVAIAAVALLFYVFLWPVIQKSIVNQTCKTYGSEFTAYKGESVDSGSGAKVYKWKCCNGENGSGTCYDADLDDNTQKSGQNAGQNAGN